MAQSMRLWKVSSEFVRSAGVSAPSPDGWAKAVVDGLAEGISPGFRIQNGHHGRAAAAHHGTGDAWMRGEKILCQFQNWEFSEDGRFKIVVQGEV